MSVDEYREKAINMVQEAIKADQENRLEDAFTQYMRAFEWFQMYLKYEKNEKAKLRVKEKVKEYFTRAEEIKTLLDKQKSKKTAATMSAGGGGGGNGKEDEVDSEKQKMREGLESAILVEKPNVKWDDVAGLDTAKEALKEAVILPIKFPHLFAGKVKPWKGILLYGPPGTGKSFLAKAVATEANVTFFSVSSADLMSKYVGDSEKMVRHLFEMARERKPSIIFIDEVDAMCSSRDGGGGGSSGESATRMKTEFLVQMDGVGKDQTGVLLLGATNVPWALDQAIRRRFERRIYIPLPDEAARRRIIQLNAGDDGKCLKTSDFRKLAEMTEGYSGADLAVIVRDALMQPIRKVQTATHFKVVSGPSPMDPSVTADDLLTPCSPGDDGAVEMTWMEVEGDKLVPPRVTLNDFMKAVQNTKPSVNGADVKKQEIWTKEFGIEGN